MHSTRYLIVGGGMTGDAAAKGIREHDADGPITLVGDEPHPPYKRPPLTKGLWSGGDEAKIWRGTADAGVELRLGRRIVSRRPRRTARDGRPGRGLRVGEAAARDGRTAARARRTPTASSTSGRSTTTAALRAQAEEGVRFVVVGGGFIGSEIAAALTGAGARVTMVFPDPGIACAAVPGGRCRHSSRSYYREKGVEVLGGER